MRSKEIFKIGVKPAITVNYKTRQKGGILGDYTIDFKELSQDFPFLIFEHRNLVLFFNGEESKEWFMVNGLQCGYSAKLGGWLQDYKQDILGYVLGFPPSAVHSFKYKLSQTKTPYDGVKVDYYGIQFVCEPHDVGNCLAWLKTYRPVPDWMKQNKRVYVDDRCVE